MVNTINNESTKVRSLGATVNKQTTAIFVLNNEKSKMTKIVNVGSLSML